VSVQACTIVTRSFLPHARLLAASLTEHDRGCKLAVLVVDGTEELHPSAERFRLIRPGDLDLEPREFLRMAAIYDAAELSVSLRPWVIRAVLDQGASAVLWLDADVDVFAPFDDVVELTERHGIVLTPHAHEPLPRDGLTPDELDVIRAGPFSGGLVGVAASARAFLDWWAEPLRRDCIIDTDRGLFREKNWLTFVPCYFDHHILRDPATDVVYWSLHRRQLSWTGERYEVDGRPLRSFHFTGFDPERPDRVSRYQGPRPRVEPANYPALARICSGYADGLLRSGYREWSGRPYGFQEAANGIKLTHRIRRVYRNALVEAERTGGPDLPDPFDPSQSEEFERWLSDPARSGLISAQDRASFLIERGPYVGAPTRFGGPGRALRGLVLRALRHYSDHQREVDRALLGAVRDVDARVAALEEGQEEQRRTER